MKNKKAIIIAITALLAGAGVLFTDVEDQLQVHPDKEYNIRTLEGEFDLFVHHTATTGQTLQEISKYHVVKKGWAGIAYHFAINWKGEVFLTQSLDKATYHTKGYNRKGISIVLVGNYHLKKPTKEMIKSLELLVDALCENLDIRSIRGHLDVRPTLCPGDYGYEAVKHLFYSE